MDERAGRLRRLPKNLRMRELPREGWRMSALSPCCNAAIDDSRVGKFGEPDGHGPRFCTLCTRLIDKQKKEPMTNTLFEIGAETNLQEKLRQTEQNYFQACEVIDDINGAANGNNLNCKTCVKVEEMAADFLCSAEIIAPINYPDDGARRVQRSLCGTYDYVFDGDETICILRVPQVETPEYSRRVAEIVAAPELLAACNLALSELTPVILNMRHADVVEKLCDAIIKAQGGGA